MKFFLFVAFSLCSTISSVLSIENRSIRGSISRTLLEGDGFVGCVEVKGGSNATGTQLILGDCKNRSYGFEDRLQRPKGGIYSFYLRKDKKKCMQVNGSSSASIKDGTTLVLKPCNKKERLQLFRHGSGVGLSPIDRKDLCVHYFGATPNVGRDNIVLKNCTRVTTTGDWSFD